MSRGRRWLSINKELEKLNREIEESEAKIRRIKQEEKMLERQMKTLTRKERTHRLCTRGAALESYLPNPELVTDDQVSMILRLLFHRSENQAIIEKVILSESEKE